MADDSWIDDIFGPQTGGTATAPPPQANDSWIDKVFGPSQAAPQQPAIPPLDYTHNPESVALPPGMTPWPAPAWEPPPPPPPAPPKLSKEAKEKNKQEADRKQYWETVNFETYGQGDPSERFARAMKYAQEEREQLDKEYWDKPWYQRGTESAFRHGIPFVSTALDAANLDATLKAANALNSGTFTNGDIHTVARFLVDAEAAKKAGKAERIGQMIAAMPAFMGELFMTGGLFTEGKIAGEVAAKAAFKKVAEKAAEKGINIAARKSLVRKGAEFVAEKAIGPLAGTAALAAANPQITARSAVEQMLPTVDVFHDKDGNKVPLELGEGRSFLSALPRAYLDTMIEVGSEYSGGKLTEGAAAVLKRIPGLKALQASPLAVRARYLRTEIVKKWLGKGANRTLRDFNKALGDVGWNGIIGEALEERAGDVARMTPLPGGALQSPYENTTGKLLIAAPYEAVTNDDPTAGQKIQQEALGDLSVEAGSFAAPAIVFGVGSAAASRLDQRVQAAKEARNVAAYEKAVADLYKSPPPSLGKGLQEEAAATPAQQQPAVQQPGRPKLDVDNAEEWANNNPELADQLVADYAEGETPSRRQLGGKRFKVQGTGGSTTEQRQQFLERVRAQVERNRVDKAYRQVFEQPNEGVPEFQGRLTNDWQILPQGVQPPTGQGVETREQNGQTLIRIAPTAQPTTADIVPQGPVSAWSPDNLKNFADRVGIPRKGLNNATLRNRVQTWLDRTNADQNGQTPDKTGLPEVAPPAVQPAATQAQPAPNPVVKFCRSWGAAAQPGFRARPL